VITYPRVRDYFVHHWKGELSLPVSYWINGTVAGLGVVAVMTAAGNALAELSTPQWILVGVCAIWTLATIFTVWQLVGIWRSAGQYRKRRGNAFWSFAARAAVVFGSLASLNQLFAVAAPGIFELTKIVRGDEDYGPYQLRVLNSGIELALEGPIKFGLPEEVDLLLRANPRINTIHLTSKGGRINPARKLRKLIVERGLKTYVSTECESACTFAFVGGAERLISSSAKLGFHQPHFPGLMPYQARLETRADEVYMASRGVNRTFIERAFSTDSSTMWYPSRTELFEAKFVDRLADLNDL